jgi:multimeric flavodoxin WrbA
MKVMLLSGGASGDPGASCRTIKNSVAAAVRNRGWQLTAFDLNAMTIKPCLGCFACWMKHPGICAIRDDQEAVLKAMAASEIQIWTTAVTFGGYSSILKKSLDRAIPNILPFFIKIQGEIHHPQRYEKRRAFLGLGTLPKPEAESERIFHRLVRRNALNLGGVTTESRIFYENTGETDIDGAVMTALDLMEKSL